MQILCTLLQADDHASILLFSFYRPDGLPDVQPTVSKRWRQFWFAIDNWQFSFKEEQSVWIVWFTALWLHVATCGPRSCKNMLFCFCTLHFQARLQTSYKMTKSEFCFMLILCYNIFRLLCGYFVEAVAYWCHLILLKMICDGFSQNWCKSRFWLLTAI